MESRSITTVVIFIAVAVLGVVFAQIVVASPDEVVAVLATTIVAAAILAMISRSQEDKVFVTRMWLGALVLRLVVAVAVYALDVRDNIAPDWATYDFFGNELYRAWWGLPQTGAGWLLDPSSRYRSGWGMYYYVAGVYSITGRNAFLIQLLSCVIGATACVLVYRISRMVFPVQRVARISGLLAAVAPSMLIWTTQGIKEPLILFFLCSCLYLTLKLSRRMSVIDTMLLLTSLFCLYSLRHYVFYVVFLASATAIVFATRDFSTRRVLQGSLAVIIIGVVFAYYGAGDVAQKSFDLDRIQSGREWSARVSGSGYGGSVDITDTRAALAYLPLGTLFFLFAPFPWMIRNLNHILILPEMIAWWLASPLLFRGFWHAGRHRLPASLPICMFTVGLTIAYALYLTNFGTAHRMRVQVLSFMIIFISIGWEMHRVAKEKKRASLRMPRRHFGDFDALPIPAADMRRMR